jgi:hypothetical protein
LLIPFFGLLPRGVKRRPRLLAAWAAWMLVFHWLDLYWLVMPSLEHASSWSGLAGILVSIGMDASIVVGMTAAYLSSLISLAGDKALIPLRDPRLAESLAFENF